MIIKSVKTAGFERIYDGYRYCFKDNRTGFGDEFVNFLQHALVTIELDDISTIELYYLKNFASSIRVLGDKYSNFVKKDDVVVYDRVKQLLTLQDELYKDTDITSTKSNPENIIPTGCKRFHVIAAFTGGSIINILGLRINNVFQDADTGRFPDSYPGNAILEERVGGFFYQSFYNFIGTRMQRFDIVSNFVINKKLYEYVDGNCSLAYVSSPYGELTFFGNDSNKLQQQIQHIDFNKRKISYIIDDMIYFTFIIHSTFSTFFNLYMDLGNNHVIDHTNFKLVFVDPHISVDNNIHTKYGVRISESFDYLGRYKESLAKKEDIDLNMYNYIFFGNMITYSVKMSLDDLNKLSVDEVEDEKSDIYNKMKLIAKSLNSVLT